MEPKKDDTQPDKKYQEWRKAISNQRAEDYDWLEKLRTDTEDDYLADRDEAKELDSSEKEFRANVRWYMDLLRWQRELIRWEREDDEWERKLQMRRETSHSEETQSNGNRRHNVSSNQGARKNRQHHKRNRKPSNQSAS